MAGEKFELLSKTCMDVWNPRQSHNKGYDQDEPEGDDSWEVKAFEQDIKGNIAGTTWPPRSYTCSFCRREFRSAQALGGHMNVHRRDRATRLHGQPVARRVAAGSALNLPNLPSSSSSSSSSCVPTLPALIIQSTGNSIEGLCHLYQLHNPSGILGNYSADMNLCGATDTSSSPYSSALIPCVNPPYLSCNFTFSPLNSPVDVPRALDSSLHCYSAKAKNLASTDIGNTSFDDLNGQSKLKEIGMSEEPDLELRLGNKAAAPP